VGRLRASSSTACSSPKSLYWRYEERAVEDAEDGRYFGAIGSMLHRGTANLLASARCLSRTEPPDATKAAAQPAGY